MLVLETARLTLTELTVADTDELTALYANPTVMEFIDPGGRTPERTAEVLAKMRAQWAELGYGLCTVRERGGTQIIGAAGLLVREPGRPVELGYMLHQPYWGKGYATELATRLLRWGFDELRAPRIIADVLPGNAASVEVLRKLGFVRDGEGPHSTHRYSVTNPFLL